MRRTIIALFILASACSLGAQDFPVGQIIDKIDCLSTAGQSYALFVPSDYAPGKKWPIIYAFDPGANGRIPVERFRNAAEKYHFIVAASNNARNGPWKPIIDAAWAMRADTEARLSLDDRRIYAAGFSGGARAASLFSWMIGRSVAGVMGFGAGLARETGLGATAPSAYYGIVGTGDFNYREMKRLDAELALKNVPHWIEVIGDGHVWPSAAECEGAVAWFEVTAMRGKAIPREESILDEVYAAELETAAALERAGDACRAATRYDKLVSMFTSLRDTDELLRNAVRLKETPACRKSRRDENARDRKEDAAQADFGRMFATIDGSGRVDLNSINLRISELETEAARADAPADRQLALRLLLGLDVDAGARGLAFHVESAFRKALICFEIASRASERDDSRHKVNLYNLACALARSGDSKEALKNLKLAVDRGLHDKELILSDKDLDSLRQKPEFQAILDSLGND